MDKPATQYVELRDAKIAYRESGVGPVLLLLHGNSVSKAIFTSYQLKHFADYRTIAIDSRGHGESVSQDERYSIAQYADDVIGLCRVRGITEARVIGYSDGGNIALHLAVKAPDLFPRIVAISPNYLASGTKDGTLRLFRAAARLVSLLGRLGFRTRKALMRINLMLEDIGLSDDDLRGIQTNVMVLYAGRDLIKEEHLKKIAALIPGSASRLIERASHMNIAHKPQAIEAMRRYLAE